MNTATDSPLILALDAGTSSTRVLAFDFAGKTVGAIAQRAYSQTTTQDGGVFTDADALLEMTAQCLDETLQNISGAPVAALSMSCFWHSLMGVGPGDAPRTPLFSWADNRAAPFAQTLRERLDEDKTHARTGCLFHASFWPAKLLWLQETQPELFDGKTRWMSFGEYLALKWLGAARVSLSMASGTGLFHQNACDWDDEILSILSVSRAALSPLCDAADALNAPLQPQWNASTREPENIGAPATEKANDDNAIIFPANIASTRAAKNAAPKTSDTHNAVIATANAASTRDVTFNPQLPTLNAAFDARWPPLQNAKWFPALGDGACSNVGSGCAEKRGGEKTRIALNVGTSGALRVVLRDFSGAAPRGLFRYRLDAKRSVVGGALSNGGNVLMWARENLALPQDVEARISKMAPDAHGLTVLPFLAGERSPNWNDAARFTLQGATLDTTPAETFRAILEGASLRFARVLQLLQSALPKENDAASTRSDVADPNEKTGDATDDALPFATQNISQKVASTRANDAASSSREIAATRDQSARETAAEFASTRVENDFEIVVSGGALSHSGAWAQMMADCLGAPLIESKEAQASARGGALMALESLGAISNIADVPAERGAVLTPDAAYHALYLRALQKQNALYEKLYRAI